MANKVKVRVSDNHFRNTYSIGEKTVTNQEAQEVEVTTTVRNAVQAGNLELVEGSLAPEKDEKSFQEDEGRGDEAEEEDDGTESLEDKTKAELQEMCEEQGLKKTGKKAELVERLKNE